MKRRFWLLSGMGVLTIAVDQISKLLVQGSFMHGHTLNIIPGIFNLTYTKNTGAAFGLLADADPAFRVPFFVAVPLIAITAIYFLIRKLPPEEIRLTTGLTLVVSGALGNLIDRVRLGYVVDFLDFHWRYQVHFPAFNLADTAISAGVGLLIADLFVRSEEQEKSPNASASR